MTNVFSKSRLLLVATLVAGTLSFLATPAHAATLVVDDDGSASPGSCSPNPAVTAFRTIQAAVNAAGPGDTVKVCPGEYNGAVTIGTADLKLIGAKVGVNGASRAFGQRTESVISTVGKDLDAVLVQASGVVVDGFTIQNSNTGVNLSGTTGSIVRNNIIRNNAIGVALINVDSATVNRNKITANNNGFTGGGAWDGCIGPFDPNTTCGELNPAAGAGNGIYSDGASNTLIQGNFVGLNRNSGMLFAADGGCEPQGSNIDILGNTLQNNRAGVNLFDGYTDVAISRNKFNDNKDGNDLQWGSHIRVNTNSTNVLIGGPTTADGNTLNKAPYSGIAVRDPDFCGPILLPVGGITIQNNTVRTSGHDGIDVTTATPGSVSVLANNVRLNGFSTSVDDAADHGDGIYFGPATSGNTISNNVALDNQEHDCHDDSASDPNNAATVANTWTNNTGNTSQPPLLCTPAP